MGPLDLKSSPLPTHTQSLFPQPGAEDAEQTPTATLALALCFFVSLKKEKLLPFFLLVTSPLRDVLSELHFDFTPLFGPRSS